MLQCRPISAISGRQCRFWTVFRGFSPLPNLYQAFFPVNGHDSIELFYINKFPFFCPGDYFLLVVVARPAVLS